MLALLHYPFMVHEDDPLAWVLHSPVPIDRSTVPENLRDNPLIQHMMALTAAEEALYSHLAQSDAKDDVQSVEMLLAEAR